MLKFSGYILVWIRWTARFKSLLLVKSDINHIATVVETVTLFENKTLFNPTLNHTCSHKSEKRRLRSRKQHISKICMWCCITQLPASFIAWGTDSSTTRRKSNRLFLLNRVSGEGKNAVHLYTDVWTKPQRGRADPSKKYHVRCGRNQRKLSR